MKLWGLAGIAVIGLGSAGLVPARPGRTAQATPSTERLLRFVRERFGVPRNIKLTAAPFENSASPDFYQTIITADDGTPEHKKTQPAYVSKDGQYLVLGKLYALAGGDVRPEISRDVREAYKVPAATPLTVGWPARSTPFGSFRQVTVKAGNGATQEVYLTPDHRTLILGSIYPFSDHPEQDILRVINLANQPSVGPARAPVTIVEYADLECPSCARMHEFLERDLLPKYGDKVRVVFKEFPLVNIHLWAPTAAIANECAYQINPATFLPYRTLIFQHQNDIDAVQANTSTVRELLLDYGQQAGLDRLALASCLDSRSSLPRVEEGMREGQKLSVASTPTFFINGRPLAGIVSPEVFYQAVDEALRAAQSPRAKIASRKR